MGSSEADCPVLVVSASQLYYSAGRFETFAGSSRAYAHKRSCIVRNMIVKIKRGRVEQTVSLRSIGKLRSCSHIEGLLVLLLVSKKSHIKIF